jgi:hypothetical protein
MLKAGNSDVDYAIFVEEGTARMSPRPYLRPAFERHLPMAEALIADAMAEIAAGRG